MTAKPWPGVIAGSSRQIPSCAQHADAEQLVLNVLFTTPSRTLLALQRGSELAIQMAARIRILIPHLVPYPLSIYEPDVNPAIKIESLQEIRLRDAPQIHIQVLLCRDPVDALLQTLSPNSLVLAGARERRWPSRDMHVIKRLRKAGHHVLLFDW
jgi:hypothetical protein